MLVILDRIAISDVSCHSNEILFLEGIPVALDTSTGTSTLTRYFLFYRAVSIVLIYLAFFIFIYPNNIGFININRSS